MAAPPAELMSGTATIDDLPDGVLAEIMLRIPTPVALVHAAAVSKRWRGVTSDGKFLNDYRERHKSSPFLGLYITREFGGLPYFHKADSIHSADGGGDDDSAGGGSSDDDSDPDLQHAADMAFRLDGIKRHGKWRLLDCYNGRLLLTRDDGWLVVYNPLSRKRISVGLPQDGILRNDFSACLLQGRSDDVSSFRVVSVQRHRSDRMVHALEYDSRRKSWNHHQDGEILNKIQGTDQLEMMHAGDLVFCKYTGASLLLLDTSKMEFSVLPLPADNNPKKYAIGEIEDGVCCLAAVDSVGASNTPYLRVWRLEKQDWMLEKAMEVQQVLGEHAPRGNLYYKVRKVTNGIAVLCWSMSNLHLIIDLKTFGVMDQFEFNNDLSAFPMQLPWPPAFSMARISALNPTAAHEGEAEGAKTEGEREEEAAETGGENEEVAEDFNNKGDAAEESPPSCRHCLKQAGTLDPAPEDDEAEEEIPTPWRRCHRQKLGECGQSLPPSPPLPDHLRCRRNDGKKWRCSVRALPTISFCKYHYSKAHKGKIKKVPADGEVLAVTLQRPVATVSVMNPAAALGGEAEGAKTDVKSDEEDTETGGESEDASDDPNTECARRGEVKGLEPDGKIEEECTETAGENEDENSDTEGDDVEESPPSHHHRRKRAATSDPTWEDDEAIPTSEDEEVEILAPLCRRRRRKLGEHGDSLPDHLRCGRRDGKKWRCSARALPTVSFCEYHYTKANKGKIKKVPADGEVLAVSRRRLKYKTINSAEQYTPSTVMNPRSSEGAKIDFHRQRQSRERGDSLPLPDHLRCGRRDGKKWRCSRRALPTVSFCEYHYAKAKMGKKLPADGELLAVVHQRLKNKRKGGKNINPMVVPQATTSDRQTRDLPNGQMTISPSDPQTSGPAAMPSPVTMKGAPYETSMTKAVPRTSHHCSLTKVAGVANCENCENNFCNSCKCNNCKLSASQLLDAARHGMDAPGNPSGVKDA